MTTTATNSSSSNTLTSLTSSQPTLLSTTTHNHSLSSSSNSNPTMPPMSKMSHQHILNMISQGRWAEEQVTQLISPNSSRPPAPSNMSSPSLFNHRPSSKTSRPTSLPVSHRPRAMSDSNLASSCCSIAKNRQHHRQLSKSPHRQVQDEVPPLHSSDSSHARVSAKLQTTQPRVAVENRQVQKAHSPASRSLTRAELNKMLAERIWREGSRSCQHQRRQSLVYEAKSKLRRSIEEDLESVEIEVRDIMEQRSLHAEISISSPSLFGDVTTSSSQSSSSPPVTVELRDLRKI